MGKKPYTIVCSATTAKLFVWSGTAKSNKKYLGNLEALATVQASGADEAMTIFLDYLPLPKKSRGQVPTLS